MTKTASKGMCGAGGGAAESKVKRLKGTAVHHTRNEEAYYPFGTNKKIQKTTQPTKNHYANKTTSQTPATKEEEQNGIQTLLELLMRGRNLQGLPKGTAETMTCKVKVHQVKAINSHYCGICDTKEPVTEVAELQWCEVCDMLCILPIPRPRLELHLKDHSASLVALVCADVLLDREVIDGLAVFEDFGEDDTTLNELLSIVGEDHVLTMHPDSYRDQNCYESFEVVASLNPSKHKTTPTEHKIDAPTAKDATDVAQP